MHGRIFCGRTARIARAPTGQLYADWPINATIACKDRARADWTIIHRLANKRYMYHRMQGSRAR